MLKEPKRKSENFSLNFKPHIYTHTHIYKFYNREKERVYVCMCILVLSSHKDKYVCISACCNMQFDVGLLAECACGCECGCIIEFKGVALKRRKRRESFQTTVKLSPF